MKTPIIHEISANGPLFRVEADSFASCSIARARVAARGAFLVPPFFHRAMSAPHYSAPIFR